MRAAPFLLASALAVTLAPHDAGAQPAAGPAAPEARRAQLDRLLDALPNAPDEDIAAAVAAQIRNLWAQAASPAVTLLLERGRRNLRSEAAADAVEDFDAALVLQPDCVQAWLLRAQALAETGDFAAAMRDLRQVLTLEPRHFTALAVLSGLQEQLGDTEDALRSMQEAVAIYPRMPGAEERLRKLYQAAHGQGI
ncbi:tetratricopeptide repeat protein [Roseomonas sp. M0104]|uniref:Tetratricopeptide repeat protein n=1 Tax=Teichococcus coralli TaxID=2545983 RepID=A0A845BB19_9PROT|nr:tetratricopeptide repeat protein [Pseudoroseomonas coralli]MXP63306.1 tetratricopeptide repeat protein [Pseudoroseomonas coralli]